jgi:hypothetical protein
MEFSSTKKISVVVAFDLGVNWNFECLHTLCGVNLKTICFT